MNHIDEIKLELYILNSPKIEQERVEIENHLAECNGCKELFDSIAEFYTEVKQDLASSENLPMPKPAEIPARRLYPLEQKYQNLSPFQRFAVGIPLRMTRWMVHHPYAAGGATVMFSSFVVFALITMFKPEKQQIIDQHPGYARAEKECIVVYNKKGEEINRKHIGSQFDYDQTLYPDDRKKPIQFIDVIDIDNDGYSEIIAVFGWASINKLDNCIICYDHQLNEKWRYSFTHRAKFGQEWITANYRITRMMIGDFDKDGKKEIIAIALNKTSYPSAIITLDTETGTEKEIYWNSGFILKIDHKDIDNDGFEELFFGGVNNGHNLAALLILDPRYMNGHSPAPIDYTPAETSKGKEKYYILFPCLDIGKFAHQMRNQISEIDFPQNGEMRIGNGAVISSNEVLGVIHKFDFRMNCIHVSGGDLFEKYHQKLEAEGKLKTKIDTQYYENLRKGVQYWDGEKFVKEYTMSKYYLDTVNNR
ncbi:MAG: VCBS repeat-containing protein [Ignavibacteriales bacterium]|nr:VCBS repeat-containing protein [Ignavibacteriales bacterium]